MAGCETRGVDYVLGLVRNERLVRELQDAMDQAKAQYAQTKQRTGRYGEPD